MAVKSPPTPDATNLSIQVERGHLLKALTAVTRTVEARNTYPILANVLLTATTDSLAIRGTDLDIEITTSCPATCTPGAITVPAKTLLEIVRKFPDGAEVSMVLQGETLIVKAGRSRFQLGTIAADSFPDIATATYGESFSIDLAALFKPVSFAASQDSNKFYLNGVFMHASRGQLNAVCTDGHRLAKVSIDYAGPDFAVIIPTKTVNLIPPGEVSLSIADNKIRVEQDNVVLVSKLIEATYPDYSRVIPKQNERIVLAERSALIAAIDRLSVVANERTGRGIKLTASESNLAFEVNNPDFGASIEDMPADFDGDAYEIGFNSGYLLDLLGPVTGANVRLAFGEGMGPVLITGDNDNWLGVCMPMRVA